MGELLELFHFENDESAIVRRVSTTRKAIELFKNSVRKRVRRYLVMLRDQFANTIVAEELSSRILRIADSVRMKNDHVASIENKAALVVGSFLEDSERKTRQPNLFAAACVKQERLLLPGICDSQFAPPPVPSRKTKRHEAALNQALTQKSIDSPQHFRRPMFLGREAAKRTDTDSTIQRSRASLPAYVA